MSIIDPLAHEPNEGMIELPDCAPSKISPRDLSDAIDGKYVSKYYASELLSIKPDELMPMALLSNDLHTESSTINKEFIAKVLGLLKENDVCDKVGIQFLSKVYSNFCNHTIIYKDELCTILKHSKTAVFKLALLSHQ